MATKKASIIYLPQGSHRVRKISLSHRSILALTSLVICMVILLVWIANDYRVVKGQIPELHFLKKENTIQKTQLIALTKRINQANQKIATLQEFDHQLRVMTNLKPSGEHDQFLGIGGSNLAALKSDYQLEEVHKGLINQMHKSLQNLDTEVALTSLSQTELRDFLTKQKSLLACTPSIRPTKGWLSSSFGYRISPFTNRREFHKGIDIATRVGTPVRAPADALVLSAGREGNYGNIVTLNHGYNIKTRYGHLHKFLVKKGKYVKRGQIIAEVGKTGRTTGPHLHYEVLLNGVPVNPLRYILD